MDVFKLIILSIACMSGFMVTSYQGVAEAKGWPVGKAYINEKMSYVIVLGIMCQWGSIIISVFVNPWWSAFLVLTIGFCGNIFLTSILKSYTQFVAFPLAVSSLILVSLYVFSSTSPFQSSISHGNQNLKHFNNSIDYTNQATEFMNRLPPFEQIDTAEMEKVIELKRKALNEATLVDIEKLNHRVKDFNDHFTNEYMLGLKYFVEGHTENDNYKLVESYKLLHRWGLWYENNYERF